MRRPHRFSPRTLPFWAKDNDLGKLCLDFGLTMPQELCEVWDDFELDCELPPSAVKVSEMGRPSFMRLENGI